jgi:hypothetical protein
MTSATFDLQPMSTGDILDRSVRLYRRHFLHILAIVSIPYLVIVPGWAMLGAGATTQSLLVAGPSPILIIGLVLFGLIYLWLTFVSMGALARSVSEHYLGGMPTLRAAYAPVLERGLSLIWAYCLVCLTAGGMIVVAGLLTAVAVVVVQQLPTMVGYLIAAVLAVGVIVAVVFAAGILWRSLLVPQVIVIEDVRGWAAVKRSSKLTRSCGWKATVIVIFGFVVSLLIGLLVGIPAGIVAALSQGWPTAILSKAVESLSQILSTPLMMIAFTLMYYDSRIRQEAFDLEMMAQNLGAMPDQAPAPVSQAIRATPPPVSTPAPAGLQARPANSPRPPRAFRACPKCGTHLPSIQLTCWKCGTRVPYQVSP